MLEKSLFLLRPFQPAGPIPILGFSTRGIIVFGSNESP